MSPVGFEPAIPASERLQTYALDRAATGTDLINFISKINYQDTLYFFYWLQIQQGSA